jgi:hypothetical protein
MFFLVGIATVACGIILSRALLAALPIVGFFLLTAWLAPKIDSDISILGPAMFFGVTAVYMFGRRRR